MGFQRIAIFGLGLIGGSLAAAFKKSRISAQIVGVDRATVARKALKLGLVHEAYEIERYQNAITETDLVILATPIHSILKLLPDLLPKMNQGVLVTDVGSTKEVIVNEAAKHLPSGVFFLGGHPMTGSERSGLEHADPLLYENAVYVLVESETISPELLSRFTDLIQSIGAKILLLSAQVHDQIAATVSHLPQLLAVALMQYASGKNRENKAYLKLAAGGFRDMTRIASSPYGLWSDIFKTNEKNVLDAMESFLGAVLEAKGRLKRGQLASMFEEAARNRLSIPKDTRGFLRRHYDLSVVIEDKPGVIASIATILSEQDINIKDIEVLKVREGDSGTLRLSLETGADRERARALLNQNGFPASFRD
ncbi:prephenate dehydrogenase [bacterium]|nr:prephenate dehydrogenase [bacterium]